MKKTLAELATTHGNGHIRGKTRAALLGSGFWRCNQRLFGSTIWWEVLYRHSDMWWEATVIHLRQTLYRLPGVLTGDGRSRSLKIKRGTISLRLGKKTCPLHHEIESTQHSGVKRIRFLYLMTAILSNMKCWALVSARILSANGCTIQFLAFIQSLFGHPLEKNQYRPISLQVSKTVLKDYLYLKCFAMGCRDWFHHRRSSRYQGPSGGFEELDQIRLWSF